MTGLPGRTPKTAGPLIRGAGPGFGVRMPSCRGETERTSPGGYLPSSYLQSRTERPFKKGYTIEDLNKRFYAHWNGDKEWKYLHKAKKPNKEAV